MRSDPDKPAPRDNLDLGLDFGEPDSDEGVDSALRNQLLWAFPHEQDTDVVRGRAVDVVSNLDVADSDRLITSLTRGIRSKRRRTRGAGTRIADKIMWRMLVVSVIPVVLIGATGT